MIRDISLWDVECKENDSITFDDILGENYNYLTEALRIQGFEKPSPIQTEAIKYGLKGNNIVAQSKSGTGKTISFLSLILAKVKKGFGLQAIVVSPTRELSNQIYNVAYSLNESMPKEKRLNLLLLIGGLPLKDDQSKLKLKPDVVFGTVGRMFLHFKEGSMKLDCIRLMVCDEADILIKGKDFRKMFGMVRTEKQKRPLQICCYSATFSRENFKKYCRFLYPCMKINNDCMVRNVDMGRKKNRDHTGKESRAAYKIRPEDYEQEKARMDEERLPVVQQSLNVKSLDQYLISLPDPQEKSLALVKMAWIVRLLKSIHFSQCLIFYNDKGRGDQIIAELK